MKLEIIILAIVAFYLYDTYYGGKNLKWLYSLKKYYKMAMYLFMGIFIYILIKSKDPRSINILHHGFDIIRSMPLDKSYTNAFSPIFDMTKSGYNETTENFMEGMNNAINPLMPSRVPQGRNGGMGTKPKGTKRSVGEGKKRYVASLQQWKCANCNQQLNHTFEVDHKIRLEYGGSNDVGNLSALCRNCHGLKTAQENIEKFE